MEIYLVRHTKPEISKGVCYGQSDLELANSFQEELTHVLSQLPEKVEVIYSSPLKRCLELARSIPHKDLRQADQLKEMDFGDWELKPWDSIPLEELNPWMEDFVEQPVPNGESMRLLAERITPWFRELIAANHQQLVIVTHAGPIRIILSLIHETPLEEAFQRYQVEYGEVILLP